VTNILTAPALNSKRFFKIRIEERQFGEAGEDLYPGAVGREPRGGAKQRGIHGGGPQAAAQRQYVHVARPAPPVAHVVTMSGRMGRA